MLFRYGLEYGKNTLELHVGAVKPGQSVLLVDDLLATGGTLKAAKELIEMSGGKVVGVCCLVELTAFNARENLLKGIPVYSLIKK